MSFKEGIDFVHYGNGEAGMHDQCSGGSRFPPLLRGLSFSIYYFDGILLGVTSTIT
jgi:hypothetical protein